MKKNKVNELRKKKGHWSNFKTCLDVALKYQTRNEFFINERSCYSACAKYGWVDKVCSHMKSGFICWTKEKELKQIKKINKLGEKFNPGFIYVRNTGIRGRQGMLLIEIMNCETKELKSYEIGNIFNGRNPFHKPFAPNKRSDKEIEDKVRKVGMKSTPPFMFVKICGRKNGEAMVEIKNIKTKESVVRGANGIIRKHSNPWYDQSLSIKEIKRRINEAGKKSDVPFRFLKDTGRKTKSGIRLIEVEHKLTKETCISSMSDLFQSKVSWNRKYSEKEMEISVNKVGKKAFPKFHFLKSDGKKGHLTQIIIKQIGSNKVATCILANILVGSNPFSDGDRYEKNVLHKKFKKILIEKKVDFKYEFSFPDRSRADFVLTTQFGKKIIVEIKNDRKDRGTNWMEKTIVKQKRNYERQGRNVFKESYLNTFVVSPKGDQHCAVSFDTFLKNLDRELNKTV